MFTNNLEIRVFGLRRSGNHALINWLGSQSPFKPHFFNCAPNDGGSPFLTGKKGGGFKGSDTGNIWYPHLSYKGSSKEELERVRNIHKEVLIYSYEELSLKKVANQEMPYNREDVIGKSKKRIDILILRDLCNWLASKIIIPEHRRGEKYRENDNSSWQNLSHKRFEKNRKKLLFFNYFDGWEEDASVIRGLNWVNLPRTLNIWLQYAKEFLGETSILQNLITINYDKWVVNRVYRKNIIDAVGFEFTDKGKNLVSRDGGGSTFQKYEMDARKLNVFDRWEYLSSNKIFKDIIKYHVEHMKYNNIIFGENSGITEWLNK